MNYFKNKNDLRERAISHNIEMEQFYSYETLKSIRDSVIIDNTRSISDIKETATNHMTVLPTRKTDIRLEDTDTVSAIFEIGTFSKRKIAALNFASFKNPGGMFLQGSSAQEEMLCHESNLYNILSNDYFVENFYTPNRKRLNNGMYADNAIYIPDVVFVRGTNQVKCDIITCAAPNTTTAKRYNRVSDEDIFRYLDSRISTVLYVAALMNVEILILGAFGCGVFGNNPTDVASIFLKYLTTELDGTFDSVYFAVPKGVSGRNYDAFECVLKEYLK